MKKDVFNLRLRNRWLLVSLLALLAGTSPAWADELTVANGETTNSYTPFDAGNADYGIKGEYIIPAEELTAMTGMSITKIKLYAQTNNTSTKPNYGPFQIFLKEVENATPYSQSSSAFQGMDDATIVYEGTVVVASKEMLITFDTPYDYKGGNLLIGFYKDKGGYYYSNKFYGVNQDGYTGCSSYSSSGISSITTGTGRSFIPKTTFTYEATSAYKKPATLTYTSVTSNSAVINWTAGSSDSSETGWDLEYKTSASDTWTEVHGLSASTFTYSLTSLEANTSYDVRVRAIYSAGESDWKAISFKTEKISTPATGFTDNFETDKGWELINGTQTNKWVRSTATNNGGSNALYISNDGGTTNAYSHSASMTFATKLFAFEAGDFTIAYDWKANGESTYDFLRVALVPASEVLIAGTTPSSFAAATLPTGWQALDGGSKLNLQSDWQSKSVDITIESAGSYQIVFAWKNDGSGGNQTPAAAIDNFKILGATPVLELGGDVAGTTLAFGSVAETTNKTITITNSGKVAMENITLTETADEDNVFAYAALPKTTLAANESMDVTVTFSGSSAKDYTGTFRVSADDCDPIDVTVTATYSNSPATMAVKLDESIVGEVVAFGSVGKAISKTFTVTNDGDQTLNVTIASDNTTDFTVSPASLEVAGHSSETFKVTFVYPNESPVLDVEKTANITVTPSNEGLNAKTFAVTGTRIEQWSEDFSGNALPEGWEAESYNYYGTLYGWTIVDNVAKAKYRNGYSYYLTTPSLTVESTTDVLSFDYAATANQVTIAIQKSKDGGDWETCNPATAIGTLSSGNSGTATITGLEAGNYKFRFKADDYNLDNFQGFKRNLNDPKLGIYTDADCTVAAATAETKNFKFATTTQTAYYYIKNDGTGTMTLSKGEDPAGFTATLDKTSVAAGEHATLTITMPAADNTGYHSGNIVVTATNLGTFTVTATGVVVDEEKMYLDFTSDDIPTSWTKNSWAKNASGWIENSTYSSSSIVTSKLTAVAGEELVIEAKMYTTSYTLGVNYKKEGDENWTELIPAANIGTNWTLLHATLEDAGTYQLQFVGTRAQIRQIYGLVELSEPVMNIYDGESLAGNSHNFGEVTDENDATWTLTVKNVGTGKLTGLAAAFTGTNADHYTAVITGATGENNDEIAAGAEATITVTQLKDNLGSHSATLTISANGLDSKVITLSGSTRDHTKLYVDFANNAFPEGWQAGANWAVTSGYAYQSSSSIPTAFVTTPLTVAENETLTFKVKKYGNGNKLLQIRYSQNGGITWSDYVEYYNTDQATSSYTEKEVTDIPTGNIILEFYGNNIIIDNIQGFSLATAPALALTESGAAVVNGNTKAFGKLSADGVATYTLKNIGNANMESTVTTTGEATVAISGEGEGVTIVNNTVTLAAGKSATITLTVPYTTSYGEKSGVMTIATEGWVGDMVVNYTATTIDPDAINVDFAEGRPAGWYAETGQTTMTGWVFSNGDARVSTSVDKTMITEMYGAAEGKNVLSFEAKAYSGSEQTLKVSTSTDRKTWSEPQTFTLTSDYQTISLNELANGSYYVKFVATNATIDNLSGLKKLTAPEHDLYVSTSTFPTKTLLPETENGLTASATVYSLRAAETGVYAKLFLDEEAIATAGAQDISLNGSATFNFTCNVPATEKTYATKIVVYYSNDEVAFETLATDITVSETRTLQITNFARTSEATVDADASNQFTSTFNVTVKNNGTVAQDVANVSVSITDADGNVIGENATTWTLANSQTVFINPGAYTTNDAVLAIWRWNTDSDGEWAQFTKINDDLYSVERNGKTNFCIVRLKKEGDDGYSSENGGLNWDNYYNQSTNMTNTDGNFFSFKDWEDKDGEDHQWFEFGTMTNLPVGASTTMAVSVTTSALEGGVFTFKAKENLSNTVSSASANVTVNAAAPKFELALGSETIEDGDAVAYGIVKAATTKTFTISNTGTKLMEAPSITAPEGFEANYVAADGAEADWKLFFYKENTDLSSDQGIFKTTATDGKFIIENVNVPYEGVVFSVHNDAWTSKYGWSDEGRELDATGKAVKLAAHGDNANGWMTIPAGNYDFIWNANDLTLLAKPAGSILAGETADVNVTLKAEQGKVSGNLTFTYKVDATTNNTFNVALSGRSIDEDTWSEDFATEIPSTWQTGIGYNKWTWDEDKKLAYSGGYTDERVLTTPRLAAEKDEVLTYDLSFRYSGYTMTVQYSTDYKNWIDYETLGYEDAGEQEFVAPETGNYYLRFKATRYAELDNFVGFHLAPLADLTLVDTEDFSATAGRYDAVTVGRSFNAGWATVVLPFDVDASTVASKFDEGTKLYDLSNYDGVELTFTPATAIEAGKPYLMYLPVAIAANGLVFNDVVVESTVADYEVNGAWFKGNYEAGMSMAGKYGVTGQGKLAKGASSSTMKAYRAYIELPDGAQTARIMIDDTATGIKHALYDEEAERNGIYNLQGQRVEKAQKGLYIVNGKKVVKK